MRQTARNEESLPSQTSDDENGTEYELNVETLPTYTWSSNASPSSGVYRQSDLLFRKRKGQAEVSDWKTYFDAWKPNRLVWHYTYRNVTKSNEINTPPSVIIPSFQGIDRGIQCSIPLLVMRDQSQEPLDIQCRDLTGAPLSSDWEDAWPVFSRADVLKNAYVDLQKKVVAQMIGEGCRVLQQDSVSLNFENFNWGGCFSTEGDAKFRKFLGQRFTSAQLALWPEIIELKTLDPSFSLVTFSITEYFKSQGALSAPRTPANKLNLDIWLDTTKRDNKILQAYREFSNFGALEYLKTLKIHAAQQVEALQAGSAVPSKGTKTYVPLSGNVSNYKKNMPLYQVLDFMTAEWVEDRRTPKGFVEMAMFSKRMGKQLVGTPTTNDPDLHRSMFASAYALGIHSILPFNVYVNPQETSYVVPAANFSDLPDFVRANANDLNEAFGDEVYGNVRDRIIGATIEPAKNNAPESVKINHERRSEFQNIAIGTSIFINGQEFKTVRASAVGWIFLPKTTWTMLSKYGSSPIYLDGIGSQVAGSKAVDSMDLSLDAPNMPVSAAPRVKSVSYGTPKAGYTAVRLSTGTQVYAKGTEIKFAETNEVLVTDLGSGVGLLYFKGDFMNKVFPGQAILSIKSPGQSSIQNYEVPKRTVPGIMLPKSDANLLVSVRKKAANASVATSVHVVNWNPGKRSTELDIAFNEVFGFAPVASTSCSIDQPGGVPQIVVKPIASNGQSGRFKIVVNNLDTWAILRCRI